MAASYKTSMLQFLDIITISIFIAFISHSQGARLNSPKVLLPFYKLTIVNYTLEVTESALDGCYIWETSRPEVAVVEPLNATNDGCSMTARVSAISKSSQRMTAIVTAVNRATGETLRCYVIVDALSSIQIETTTRELFLEDTPADLFVHGFDDKGNLFDNLQGIEFDWTLISDTEVKTGHIVDAHNILRIVTFMESNYETPHHIGSLELRGLQGDQLLVDGIQTGTAKVSVRVKDSVWKVSVDPSTVRLVVRANILITPPDAYVFRHAQVTYRVEMVKKSSVMLIKLPSKQYYLDIATPKIAKLDLASSTVEAIEVGKTEIVLRDRNIQSVEEFNPPSAMLHVVSPGYIAFTCLPVKKWVLEVDQIYEIVMDLYDKDSHKIYPSDNVIIEAKFDPEFFKVFESTKNGTYHRVQALQRGNTQIHGALLHILTAESKIQITPEIRHIQDVEIYKKIIVEPPVLYFPWDIQALSYTYRLKATGGCGEYIWTTNDTAVSSVTTKGEINTGKIGSAQISACDVKNQAHFGSMMVHVLPVVYIEFLPSRVEALIDTQLILPLAVYALKNSPRMSFNLCHNLDFNITVADPSMFLFIEVIKPRGQGCADLRLKALIPGHTQVIVEYRSENIRLQTHITIAAYRPLTSIDPEEVAVVTPGSTKEIIFDGGPSPWVLDSTKFYQTLTYEGDKNIIKHNLVKPFELLRSYHVFEVTCLHIGELVLKIDVGNGKTAKNQFPANASDTISFACSHPVSMQLLPEIIRTRPDLPPCPALQDPNHPIPIHCSRNAIILVYIYDGNGRKFDTFSSLDIKWMTSDFSIGNFPSKTSIMSDLLPSDGVRKLFKNYQILNTNGKSGKLVVTATIKSYDAHSLTLSGCSTNTHLERHITKSLDLMLVTEASLKPSSISIFNHPSNNVKLDIVDGSGFFYVEEGHHHSTDIKYLPLRKQIQINPVSDGVRKIIAYDLCLDLDSPAVSMVTVSDVEEVELSVVDKIPVGKSIRARVRVLDSNGEPLSANFFPLMNIRPIRASDIIKVRLDTTQSTDEYTAIYDIIGSFVGHTSLSFQVTSKSGQPIISTPKPIEVFPPLRLSPRNVTLIIGAQLQILASGGPSPSSSIAFSLADDNTASISTSGLLGAVNLGYTTVVGKAQGYDPQTHHIIEYSSDEVHVFVVTLTGIRIHAPLTRLQTNTRMPVYAYGLTDHETPFTFGSSNPPLSFIWSVNNKDVVLLQSIYHESSITLPDMSNFAKQVIATAQGHVTISLQVGIEHNFISSRVSVSQILSTDVLMDEVQIQVFDGLSLISPEICDGKLLISPNTQTKVVTNRDGGAKLSYQIVYENPASLNLAVDQTGQVTTTDVTGQGSLLVISQESFGVNHTINILILVKPISYVMVTTDSVFRSIGGHMTSIPVGANIHFSVTFHDTRGNRFHATNRAIDFRLNRYDRLQVSSGTGNYTLQARAADRGHTVLKVWSRGDPRLADYINVPVDYVIEPHTLHVTLGDVVCFKTVLTTDLGHEGKWSSGGKTMMIEPRSGVAMATGLGTGAIEYMVSHDLTTYTEVTVETVDRLTVENPYKFFTNADERATYFIAVLLGNKRNVLGDNCTAKLAELSYQTPLMPFRCSIEMTNKNHDITIAELFTARAIFDSQRGSYGCQVIQSNNHHMKQAISTVDTSLVLRVYIPQHDPQPVIYADQISLPFFPALYLHTLEGYVELSNEKPENNIRVTATPKLHAHTQLISSHPDVVQVKAVQSDPHNPTLLIYPITLLETSRLWNENRPNVTLTLICRASGQKRELLVSLTIKGLEPEYLKYSQAGLTSLLGTNNLGLIILIAAIISPFIALIVYNSLSGQSYGMTAAPGSFTPRGSPGEIIQAQGSPYASPTPLFGYPRAQDIYSQSPYNIGNISPQSIGNTPYRLWSTGYRPQESSPTQLRNRSHSPQASPYQ